MRGPGRLPVRAHKVQHATAARVAARPWSIPRSSRSCLILHGMDLSIGRAHKRQRLSDPSEHTLYHCREQNDLRLKSTFETIFEKYGKDFDGVGDEIDLETGEILVDNGHIFGMVNERDAGNLETGLEDGGDEDDYDEDDESDDDWPDEKTPLASTLLSETRRRIDALENTETYRERRYLGEALQSDDDADSLLGFEDSPLGDTESRPSSSSARQISSKSPDSLFDDEEIDELASSESECPGLGQAWPTPAKATSLGHTPWHSSPLKPLYSSSNSIDPAWRAPSLPIDREPKNASTPAGFPMRHEVKDLERDYTAQIRSLPTSKIQISTPEKASHIRSLVNTGSLGRQRKGHDLENGPLLREVESVKSPKWTKAEERLLRYLGTSTTMTCREMKPYFPGRRSHAIMIHWSEMNGNERVWNPSSNSPKFGTNVPSKQRRSSTKKESSRSPTKLIRKGRASHKEKCISAIAAFSTLRSPALNGGDYSPHDQSSSLQIKQEEANSSFNPEVPNTSDPTDQSQEWLSFSPAPCSRPWPQMASAKPRMTIHGKDPEREREERCTMTTPSRLSKTRKHLADTDLPSSANTASKLSRRSHEDAAGSTYTRSTSNDFNGRRDAARATPSDAWVSPSRCTQPSSSKAVARRSLVQSEDSEDELSAPIKTIGMDKVTSQAATTPKLSDMSPDRRSFSMYSRS